MAGTLRPAAGCCWLHNTLEPALWRGQLCSMHCSICSTRCHMRCECRRCGSSPPARCHCGTGPSAVAQLEMSASGQVMVSWWHTYKKHIGSVPPVVTKHWGNQPQLTDPRGPAASTRRCRSRQNAFRAQQPAARPQPAAHPLARLQRDTAGGMHAAAAPAHGMCPRTTQCFTQISLKSAAAGEPRHLRAAFACAPGNHTAIAYTAPTPHSVQKEQLSPRPAPHAELAEPAHKK
jgi:hypothetical protein